MPLVGNNSKLTLYLTIGSAKIAYALPFRSESINPKFNNINNSEALLASRTPVGVFVGNKVYEGSIDVELFDVTDAVSDAFRHELLAVLFWTILGNYDSASNLISLGTSAPKIDYIKIEHDNAVVYYDTALLSGFSLRMPVDGVPTATLDVRAKAQASSSTIDLSAYTVVGPASPYSQFQFYNAKYLALKVGGIDLSDKVFNFEMSVNQNLLDYFTYGSLDARGIDAGALDLAEITLEYYPTAVEDIDLSSALAGAFNNGTKSAQSVSLEITSVVDETKTATLTLASPFVVEYSHDVSGPEYISARLGLRESASNITLGGVKIKTA
jgi:hypothetical protein